MTHPRFECLVLAIMAAATQTLGAADATITKTPAMVTTRTFDPKNRPKEMPELKRGEAAVTSSSFSVGSTLTYEPLDGGIRVQAIKVTTGLKITIWLPQGAPAELKAHEEAHRKIGEAFYKDADRIAREAALPYVGRALYGEGTNAASARQAAIDEVTGGIHARYLKQTQHAATRVNELFDQITDHGRKRKPAAEEAIKLAMEKYREESR